MVSVPSSDRPRRLVSPVLLSGTPGSSKPGASDAPRIFSRAESEALFKRIVACATGGGDTQVTLRATWTANLRWGRNRPISSGDTVEQTAIITRFLNGASLTAELTLFDDATLKKAVQQLEQRLSNPNADPNNPLPPPLGKQEYLKPTIWSDATFAMSLHVLSDAAQKSVDPVVDAGLVAAGYAEIGATSWAVFNTRGLDAYAAATGALYTETVRIPDGSGSGWAAKSHIDWAKLDPDALSKRALQKCRDSANPVKVEPGRYTAILEPKAAALLMRRAVKVMDRDAAETQETVYTLTVPEGNKRGVSKIGHQVFDPRISITSDPTDPDCGYIPFDPEGNPYRKVAWVENGVLKELPYDRQYARQFLGNDTPLPNPLSFRMSGGDTSVEEMIETTERGIYVTHFGRMAVNDLTTLLCTTVTRDGLWLIEHGKITRPIKNLWINESPMVIFNQVLQLGEPVRIDGVQEWNSAGLVKALPTQALNNGHAPIVAPLVKVKDFNFVRVSDAV